MYNLVDKKQNITFSFDPVSMICYNCAGGGHRVCNEGGGVGADRSSFFPTKIFLQLFLVLPVSALKLSESRTDHYRNCYSVGWTLQKEKISLPDLSSLSSQLPTSSWKG
jgi:hypothetical protein